MPENKEKGYDEEIAAILKEVADHFDGEDRATRERQLRYWRRLKLYWNNFSQIYWSDKARNYRILDSESVAGENSEQAYYDRPINVFKAFLETIIAALSIQIPGITCVPDDADNPIDISTAKAGDMISELIYKHNDVVFLWLQALYIYCTEGMIACYTHKEEDEKFGTYSEPKYKEEEVDGVVCSNCQERIADELLSNAQLSKFNPDDKDAELDSELKDLGPVCPNCSEILDENLQKTKLTIKRIVGYTDKPKARVKLDVFGGMYIKVAQYAKNQLGTPYLIYSHETHYAMALECYPKLKDEMPQDGWSNIGANDPYEQYARLNPQYRGEYPEEMVTVKNCWLRPAAFNILPQEKLDKIKNKFPDGARIVLVNTVCAEYENESLDDHWTLTENPLSDYLSHDPLGELLTNIQDITNDLISLTLQTIEHGIPQTFVDPSVVNLDAQKQIEAMPGTLTATKQVSNSKNISEAFHTMQTSSVSPELFQFYNIIQQLGQFVSGALPSLFGGQQSGQTSRTASEYAMSKGMALQRLQTPWKMMTIWWKKVFSKAIPLYMTLVQEDERIVQKNSKGEGYINVYIRKAELDGKIGDIELEPDEKLPITDEQQSDMIMQLFQLNNETIMKALMDPENLPYIKKVAKIPQFRLPGEDDRQKQYEEITQLLNEQPLVIQGQEASSVDVDVDVDDHSIEASICRSWLISSAGRLAKIENPNGYKNVLLHMKEHVQVVNQQMQAQRTQNLEDSLVTNDKGSKETPAKAGKSSESSSEEGSSEIKREGDGKYPVQ